MCLCTNTYKIIPFSADSGFIEVIANACSLDEIGCKSDVFLVDYFKREFVSEHLDNFTRSFAFSAIAAYVL